MYVTSLKCGTSVDQIPMAHLLLVTKINVCLPTDHFMQKQTLQEQI